MESRSLPASIGRFRIDSLLGAGGMGEVYKAFDPHLQRTVALKTVRPEIASPEYLERLHREAQACGRLQHPNIVTVFEAGEIGGVVFIAMEYLKGENLAEVLWRGGLTFEGKLRTLMQILDALQHAHSEDVVHRDIKPSNVHRLPDGSIKLVDFGLARMMHATPLTVSGSFMGTPNYASPEQLKGAGVDKRTDVYSTGALAYEMFSGRRPFASGDDDSVSAVMLRVLSEAVGPIDTPQARRFPEIERIVARAMAKSPHDRYQSAEDMRDALAAFLDSSGAAIRSAAETTVLVADPLSAGVVPPVAPVTPTGTASQTPAIESAPRRASRRAIVAALIAIALVTAGAAGFSLWPPKPSTPIAGVTSAPAQPVPVSADGSTQPGPGSAAPAPNRVAERVEAAPNPKLSTASAGAALASPPPVRPPTAGAPASASGLENPPSAPIGGGAAVAEAKRLFFVEAAAAPNAGGSATPAVKTGLRYRLVQQLASGKEKDVDPATTFRTGDVVRFLFESNIDGYLYVVQEGSSGDWNLLFPHPEINGGRNAIKRFEQYPVPSEGAFRFDGPPGTERIFVFLSKEPSSQLPEIVRAATTVRASVVAELERSVKSRDLVWQKESSPARDNTQATYVVNRDEIGSAIAAFISLAHAQ